MHKFESHVLYATKVIEVEFHESEVGVVSPLKHLLRITTASQMFHGNLRDPLNATPPRNKALLRETNG